MRHKTDRGFAHGVPFTAAEIAAQLETEPWEDDIESSESEIRSVWLGTVFGITPSGKIYAPFACGNVAGDCPACNGDGVRTPRTGKRARRRARNRAMAFARGTLKRGSAPNCRAYVARVAKMRAAAYKAECTTCHACDANGSISAARDERYREALEKLANEIDAYVYYHDDSIFISQLRDKVDSEENDVAE